MEKELWENFGINFFFGDKSKLNRKKKFKLLLQGSNFINILELLYSHNPYSHNPYSHIILLRLKHKPEYVQQNET